MKTVAAYYLDHGIGLSFVTGSWIGWVDSDDWIEPDLFRYLLENAIQAQADIAVCSRYEIYNDHQVFRGWKEKAVLNTEAALSMLLENDSMQNFLWDKLWKRELFSDLVFPEGHTYEDIAVMHRLFEKANRVVCLPEAKYYYLQRSGSIVDNISLGNRIDHYNAARARCDDMKERWPQFYEQLEAQCVASAIGIWSSYYANPKEIRKNYLPQLRKISQYAKAHYKEALLVLAVVLSGCSLLKGDGASSSGNTLQALGVAYSAGDYQIENAYCTGYITSSQTKIRIAIPVSKRFVEGQTITATSVTKASLRTGEGQYVQEQEADLTSYIDWARSYNDGAVLVISLNNPEAWIGTDGNRVRNNTVLVGSVNVTFSVSDP